MRLQTGHRQGRPGGPHRRGTRPPSRQRGVILVLLLLVFISGASLILLQRLNAAVQREDIDTGTRMALAQAREALLAWAVTHPNAPGLLPWPDRNGDGNYDGASDCATTATSFDDGDLFIGVLPSRQPSPPCEILVNGLGIALRDGSGEPMWYAVSRNLVRRYTAPIGYPVINPGLLNAPTTPATVPWPDVGTGETYPWLTVRGPDGAIIADDVAAVLIAPGTAIGNQDRAVGNPADYLDAVTVGGVTYSNADADEDFIIHPQTDRSAGGAGDFNDQLVFITARELLAAVEQRVLGDVRRALEAWRIANGSYPWLVNFSRMPDGAPDAAGQQASAGFLPIVDEEGNPGYQTQITIGAWNISGGTVSTSGASPPSANCVRGTGGCTYVTGESVTFINQFGDGGVLDGATWNCEWRDKNPLNGNPLANPERDLACMFRVEDIVPGVDREFRLNLQDADVTINPQAPTALRTRDMAINTLPATDSSITITDFDTGGAAVGVTTLDLNAPGAASLELRSVAYHMDPRSSRIPEWFADMGWHRFVYVAYPPAVVEPLPGAPGTACTAGVDCLALCVQGDDCPGDGGPPPALRNVRALVLGVGPARDGQDRAVLNAAAFMEQENADADAFGNSDNVFARGSNVPDFNDRLRVLMTSP